MVYMMAVYLVLLVSATSKYPWNLDTSVGSSTLPWMPVEHSWYAPEYQTPAGGATMKKEESDNRIGFEVMCLGRRSNVSIEKPGNFGVPNPLRTYGSTSSFLDFGNFDVPSPLLTYGSTSSFEHRDLFVEFFVESCALCAVDESLEMEAEHNTKAASTKFSNFSVDSCRHWSCQAALLFYLRQRHGRAMQFAHAWAPLRSLLLGATRAPARACVGVFA